MKAKVVIFLLSLVFFTMIKGYAQERNDWADIDRMRAEKIAFLKDAINLTPQENAKFWPIYEEYDQKKWDIIKARGKFERDLRENLDKMTEKEYKEQAKAFVNIPKQESDLNVEYNEKFLKIISAEKVVRLYIAEINYTKRLLRGYRDNYHRPRED